MGELAEIVEFLRTNSRPELKQVALQNILGLTGSEDGIRVLVKEVEIVKSIICLAEDDSEKIAKDACLALVNLSASEDAERVLLSTNEDGNKENIVEILLRLIMDPSSSVADPCCMVLSNLTRPTSNVELVISLIEKSVYSLDKILSAFTKCSYNTKGASLDHLASVFSNLSQSATFRRYITDKKLCVIQRLLPFTEHKSHTRKAGIVATLKNVCFDVDNHDWLIGPQVDILPYLLLPLAGPEEFSDEEMDQLHPQLQYLPHDKVREPDSDIRKMLLEAVLQLCAKRSSREVMRKYNIYLILREFHKWETNRTVLLACENVVDILIRTEEEIGRDLLRDIEVPLDLQQKFEKMDEDFTKENQ